ncbi:MAG: hypothetical protein CMJ18_26265 [Phycisphaeraceae bacterium]|nr:hypothetical protein [Phycisphaeraceae bacterium]
MSRKLEFALIGCGSFGEVLGRYILEVADIAAVCDVNEQSAAQTARALKLDVPVDTDFEQTVRRPGLDAVAITAANFVHAPIAIAAAEAGLHIFCEKAMARTVAECWEMVRACRKKNLRLTVGHKRRLRPSWGRMIDLTRDDGPLGAPLAITVSQYADMRPYAYPGTWWADPQLSGGHLAIIGVHVIDWFRAMCGDARHVSAVFGPRMDEGYKYPDVLHATIAFHGGAVASINSTLHNPLQKFRQAQGPMVQCRHGGMCLSPDMETIELNWQRLDEESPHRELFAVAEEFDPAYRREMGDFVRWVTEDRTPCLTWVEGLRCVELMEAIYRSAEQDGAKVELPLSPEV